MTTKLEKKIEKEANREVSEVVPTAERVDVQVLRHALAEVAAQSGYTSSGKDESPVEAAMESVAAAVPDSLHALDTSPVNSKIVVTDEGPILATPDFETVLPKGDPAHRLPVGAKILKRAEGIYWSIQMSPAIDHPMLVTATARDAIAQFVPHFHED